jgi:hypothetical protein
MIGALPTVAAVLSAHHIPVVMVSKYQRTQRAYDALAIDGRKASYVAWTSVSKSGSVQAIHVLRYDRRHAFARALELRDTPSSRASFSIGRSRVMVPCMGAITGMQLHAGSVFVSTHLTPSAQCTFVFSPSLRQQTVVSGWPVGQIGSRYTLFRESTPHFGPPQPIGLAVYDAITNRIVKSVSLPL